jgi:hypothetical protein
MPARVMFDRVWELTPHLALNWMAQRFIALPAHSLDQMVRFLRSHDVLYGPYAAPEFAAQFGYFMAREPPVIAPFRGFSDDWSFALRQPLREANTAVACAWRALDCGQDARLRRQRENDSRELAAMNRQPPCEVVSNLLATAIELNQTLLLGETHGRDGHNNVTLLRGFCGVAGPQRTSRRIIRVLLDGVVAAPGNTRLTHARVQRNYGDVDPALFARCEWYGIEPPETEMLTICGGLANINRTRSEVRSALLNFLQHLEHDEEYRRILRLQLADPRFRECLADARTYMLTGPGSAAADGRGQISANLPLELAMPLKLLADSVEFADNSLLRMDANIAWCRTIEAVRTLPRAHGQRVTVVVLCGLNHLLMRARGSLPVQAMLNPRYCMSLCLATDATPGLALRRFNDSSNFVMTMPVAWAQAYERQLLTLAARFG